MARCDGRDRALPRSARRRGAQPGQRLHLSRGCSSRLPRPDGGRRRSRQSTARTAPREEAARHHVSLVRQWVRARSRRRPANARNRGAARGGSRRSRRCTGQTRRGAHAEYASVPPDARVSGPGVHELRLKDRSGIYRVIYALVRAGTIHVLHTFKKTTEATPTKIWSWHEND